jgi:hypothetical protein
VLDLAGHTKEDHIWEYGELDVTYHRIEADDDEGYPMLDLHLDACQNFISKAKDGNGRCLVHCEAGLNRSGVIVAASAMLENQDNVLETVNTLCMQRGDFTLLNESFQEQLVTLARIHRLLGPPPGTAESLVKEMPPPEPDHESSRMTLFRLAEFIVITNSLSKEQSIAYYLVSPTTTTVGSPLRFFLEDSPTSLLARLLSSFRGAGSCSSISEAENQHPQALCASSGAA